MMSASDTKWTTFIGGLLLGSTLATGALYFAAKYGPRLANGADSGGTNGASKPTARRKQARYPRVLGHVPRPRPVGIVTLWSD